MNGLIPPVAETVTVVVPPLHEIVPATALAVKVETTGALIKKLFEIIQPLMSLILIV